jgi:UDP-2,4-diacetamido-2,4,6-trideoxy-beta-L-altropyranose hydrolase
MHPEILFRCDASPELGAGHVMRCLAFAETLSWAGWTCRFFVNSEAASVVPALAESGYPIAIVESPHGRVMPSQMTRAVVVDHYELDAEFERTLRGQGLSVIAFDDCPGRAHLCNILVDAAPGRESDHYRPCVPPTTKLLLGPEYAAIGRKWRLARFTDGARLADGPDVARILVSMGATDPQDATSRVLSALSCLHLDAQIDVVLGVGSRNLTQVEACVRDGMTLYVDPDLLTLARRADLAIGAAGLSSLERAVLGLPSLLIPMAENQIFVAHGLGRAGVSEIASRDWLDDPCILASTISALISDGARRSEMSRAAAQTVDGRGTERLLLALAGERSDAKGRHVSLRPAEKADADWVLDLQRQPETRRFAREPKEPSATEHAAWFLAVRENPDRLLAIVEREGRAVGMVRLDRDQADERTFEVSIAIHPTFHGEGVGSAALALIRTLAPGADLVATVLPGNRASAALFAAAGYWRESDDRFRSTAL